METYQPAALVLQCGSDSLAGDRLGCFNLSARGHADCVRHMLSYCLPTLVLGGGGCATLILERELRAVAPSPARPPRRRAERPSRAHAAPAALRYTIRNVARCWTHETAVILGEELENELPWNDYYEYYGPEFHLEVRPNPSMENANTRQYLEHVKQQVLARARRHQPTALNRR